MAAPGRTMRLCLLAGLAAAGAFALAEPASAQGFFERLFGGFHRNYEPPANPPSEIRGFAPFDGVFEHLRPQPQPDAGPASAFCVRSCDGRYFPVQAHAGLSAADAFRAFCPASRTKLYSGSGIEHAVAGDGSRYADLDTAFLYRKQLVAGCSCNGRDASGLAHIDVNSDPTFKPGDVVTTKSGLMAFTGMKNKVAEFTPVGSSRLPKDYRDKLAGMKIMPPNPGAPKSKPVTLPLAKAHDDSRHSARRAP
jgi:hypothetical protein